MRRKSLIGVLALLLATMSYTAQAQEVVLIGGERYFVHDVIRGETLYSLARRYDTTVDDIKQANSGLVEGLKAGQRIKIPVVKAATKPLETKRLLDEGHAIHKVERGETLYSLARRYGVTVDAIKEANGGLTDGLKAGQRIAIPKRSIDGIERKDKIEVAQRDRGRKGRARKSREERTPEVRTESTKPTSNKTKETPVQTPKSQDVVAVEDVSSVEPVKLEPFATIHESQRAKVALLLPLGSEAAPSRNYLDFYRGFMLGLDTLRRTGISADIKLYNTAHDHNRIDQVIASRELRDMDLIVGPIYEDELIPVASSLEGYNIPIVSPLANLTVINDSRIFQMSPAPTTKLDKVRAMFDGSKRVVIISTDNIDKQFDAEVRGMLRDSSYVVEHKYIYEHPSVIEKREKERELAREAGLEVDDTPSPSDMSPLLSSDKETVIVITAGNEVEVDRILAAIASANISLTSRSQRVAPFVIFGNNRWNRYANIDRTILFANNVTMLSTYHARRSNPKIRQFDSQFVTEFGALPSLYAYRGYDAAVLFISSLYGAIENGLPEVVITPLLTPYAFERDERNVLVNKEWITVRYNSDFTITTE